MKVPNLDSTTSFVLLGYLAGGEDLDSFDEAWRLLLGKHKMPFLHTSKFLERFRFRRNHTKGRALRCKSSTGSMKVGIALAGQDIYKRMQHLGHYEERVKLLQEFIGVIRI